MATPRPASTTTRAASASFCGCASRPTVASTAPSSSYLLEKSRLAATPRAERNFHALHYLAAAAAALAPLGPLGALVRNADSLEAALHALKLPHPTRLHFLGHGGYVGAADEATRLAPTLDSLAEMMSREQAMEVVRLLAALLHIGNLEFEDSEGVRRGEQAARLTSAGEKAAGHAAALLKCEGFHRPLLVRVVRVGRADGGDTGVYYLPRSAAAAGRARDCLARNSTLASSISSSCRRTSPRHRPRRRARPRARAGARMRGAAGGAASR